MPVTIHIRKNRGIPIVDLAGSLDIGPSLAAFSERVASVLAETKPRRLVLNLQSLSSLDSAGLGEMMLLFSMASRQNCELVIAGATGSVRQLFRITRVDGVLRLADDEQAAIANDPGTGE